MAEYTVRSGDNLWNICKREFKLTNNTDIANKVNEVIKANGITKPELLQVGQKIKIDFTQSSTEQKKYSEEVNKAVADKINYNNIQTYSDIERLENSSISIFGSNTIADGTQNQAYNDFSEKYLLDCYDINNDGTVTEEEFAQVEQRDNENLKKVMNEFLDQQSISMDGQALELPEEVMQAINAPANTSANLFAQNLDFNDNGKIDVEEFAFFNKMADGLDGQYDGVITSDSETKMFNAITGARSGTSNAEYNRVIDKYLKGETLTPDEQKTLEEAQKTIKASLRKASGLNFEG